MSQEPLPQRADPWGVAGDVIRALAMEQARNRGETIAGLAGRFGTRKIEELVSWLARIPEELASVSLLQALTRGAPEEREEAQKVWSMYAFPGGLPGMDHTRNPRILARSLLLMDQSMAEESLGRLWADQPMVIYREIAGFDPRAAACVMNHSGEAREILGELLREVDYDECLGTAVDLRRQGRLEEAFVLLAKAIAANPAGAGAHNNMGNLLKDMNLPRLAVAEYERALEADPAFGDAWYSLGCAYLDFAAFQESGRRFTISLWRQAEDAFRKAIDVNPEDADAVHNLGVVLAETGRVGEAIEAFRRALELDPRDESTRSNLATLESER